MGLRLKLNEVLRVRGAMQTISRYIVAGRIDAIMEQIQQLHPTSDHTSGWIDVPCAVRAHAKWSPYGPSQDSSGGYERKVAE